MNEANVDALIAHLEKCPPENFSMGHWIPKDLQTEWTGTWGGEDDKLDSFGAFMVSKEFPEGYCGTACCVAGHTFTIVPVSERERIAKSLHGYIGRAPSVGHLTQSVAKEWLGLDEAQAHDLFLPTSLGAYGLEDAIATLKRFRETGVIKWDVDLDRKWERINVGRLVEDSRHD